MNNNQKPQTTKKTQPTKRPARNQAVNTAKQPPKNTTARTAKTAPRRTATASTAAKPNRSSNNNVQRRKTTVAQPQKYQTPTVQNQPKQPVNLFPFALCFAAFMFLAIICIGCNHTQTDPPEQTNNKVTLDVGETTVNNKASLSTFIKDGILYINFSELALKCDMVITGSEENQTFSVVNGDNTEYMSVTAEDTTVIINGVSVQMPSKAILQDYDIWLNAEFVSSSLNGVTVKYDEENNKLTIKRTELNASTPDNPLYEKISFKYNTTDPIDTVTGIGNNTQKPPEDTSTSAPPSTETAPPSPPDTTEPETSDTTTPPIDPPSYSFVADLSEYEQYMNPENKDDYLLLVNKDNPIGKDYVPKDLIYVYQASGTADKYKMSYVAAMAFEAMVKEGKANGYNIKALSGYRSYNTQKSTFQNWLNIEIKNAKKNDPSLTDDQAYDIGYSVASMYSAPAGASEHQIGLAMDVNSLEDSFGDTPEGKWLAENCYKFGFILRYPEGKSDITGYIYEPWHFRFVGRYHAEQMHELDMCLEEYTEYLKNN